MGVERCARRPGVGEQYRPVMRNAMRCGPLTSCVQSDPAAPRHTWLGCHRQVQEEATSAVATQLANSDIQSAVTGRRNSRRHRAAERVTNILSQWSEADPQAARITLQSGDAETETTSGECFAQWRATIRKQRSVGRQLSEGDARRRSCPASWRGGGIRSARGGEID